MVQIAVVPFVDDHCEDALALLSRRHQIMRRHEPLLAANLEEPEHWADSLAATRAKAATPGLAAIAGGRLVGYLFWQLEDPKPGTIFEPFTRPGSVEASLTGLAVAEEFPHAVRRLYAAAASGWVAAGRGVHLLPAIQADPGAGGVLADLGFGRFFTLAVTSTSMASEIPAPGDLTFRQAHSADANAVRRLAGDLWRSFNECPVFFPDCAPSLAELHEHADRYLATPANSVWLAERGGHAEAMQLFLGPDSDDSFLGPPIDRSQSMYLFWASTDSASRGKGVQTFLLQHTRKWARDRGLTTMVLHYLNPSFASEFWQRNGFRPVMTGMIRQIDPRAVPVLAP